MATPNPTPDAWIARRELFESSLFSIVHITCRPTPDQRHQVEHMTINVVALPTSGVFALHPTQRQHLVATPSHAVFLSSGRPYRVTFPGCIGDECITLRLTAEGLDRLVPEAMFREGFKESFPGGSGPSPNWPRWPAFRHSTSRISSIARLARPSIAMRSARASRRRWMQFSIPVSTSPRSLSMPGLRATAISRSASVPFSA
jgi:hypothetical protein